MEKIEMIGPAGREMISADQVDQYLAKGWETVEDYVPKPTENKEAPEKPVIQMKADMREAMAAHHENEKAKAEEENGNETDEIEPVDDEGE